jgi:hypothetical protein
LSKLIVSLLIILAFTTAFSTSAFATEDEPVFSKHFYNMAILGTVAGLLLGLAVGQGSITTFKVTSLGLYGGIILGLTTEGAGQKLEQNPSELSPKAPTYVFTFHY